MSIKSFVHRRPAFTLFEMLITLCIFSIVAMISVSLLVNGLRSTRKIQAQVLLYSEAQAVMDQMERDVERNTVDYEAYYARNVKGDTGWDTPNYGQYAQSFYHPGTDGTEAGPYSGIASQNLYQAQCPSDSTKTYPVDCPTDVPDYSQLDKDTGEHPFSGLDAYTSYTSVDSTYMNAFCETTSATTDCNAFANGVKDELILVNGTGDARTIYALQPFDATSENFLAKMELAGTDTTNDGVVDHWECNSNYACTGTDADGDANTVPLDITDFAPLTPEALSIQDFYVIITPFEDPYRGFAEADAQVQPQVTLVLTVTLSDEYSQGLLGDLPSITIQRTVSTGVYSKVPSYE